MNEMPCFVLIKMLRMYCIYNVIYTQSKNFKKSAQARMGGNGKRIDNYRKKVTDLYWTT